MNSNVPAIVEHCNQAVLTISQLAEGYQTTNDNIWMNFDNNRDHFTEGKHFFQLEGQELANFKICHPNFLGIKKANRSLLLFTEKGALLLAKSINTDVAWQAIEELVDFYFRAKDNELLTKFKEPVYATELVKTLFQAMRTDNNSSDEDIRVSLLTMREMRYVAYDETKIFEGKIRTDRPSAYIKGRRAELLKVRGFLHNGVIMIQKVLKGFSRSEESKK